MVFPKSIDSGCCDWTGGVYRRFPVTISQCYLGSGLDPALLAKGQADENSTRICWVIVRVYFKEIFPNIWIWSKSLN